MAHWLGMIEGLVGSTLLDSRWTRVLDRRRMLLMPLALAIKQLDLFYV